MFRKAIQHLVGNKPRQQIDAAKDLVHKAREAIKQCTAQIDSHTKKVEPDRDIVQSASSGRS